MFPSHNGHLYRAVLLLLVGFINYDIEEILTVGSIRILNDCFHYTCVVNADVFMTK